MLGVACWLESSNIINEPFYNSHGFKTVGEAIIGDDNPTYHGKPFPVQIVRSFHRGCPPGFSSLNGIYRWLESQSQGLAQKPAPSVLKARDSQIYVRN